MLAVIAWVRPAGERLARQLPKSYLLHNWEAWFFQIVLTGTSWRDGDGTADTWYRVYAVDTSGNESAPSPPARAE